MLKVSCDYFIAYFLQGRRNLQNKPIFGYDIDKSMVYFFLADGVRGVTDHNSCQSRGHNKLYPVVASRHD